MTYTAPIEDMRFVINDVVDLAAISDLPGCEEVGADLVEAILEEAGKFAAGVLAPLNRVGDTQGSRLENGVVRTPDGFGEAYQQFVAGGWNSITFPTDFGGQELATSGEIKEFCEVNFDVDFPLTEKTVVSGAGAHPFYAWAAEELGAAAKPRWNFHKYLVAKDGRLIDWFSTTTGPSSERVRTAIEAALAQ